MEPGIICAITGIDGVGKSTRIIPEIATRLRNDMILGHIGWRPISVIKAPTAFMDQAKHMLDGMDSPVVRAYIQMADNYLHMNTCLSRSIKGDIVLADRWWYDAFVYNYIELSKSIGPTLADRLIGSMYPSMSVVYPTLNFLCVIDPDIAFSRKPDYDYERMKEIDARYRMIGEKLFEMEIVDCTDINWAINHMYRAIIGQLRERIL